MRAALLSVFVGLAACADVPALEDRIDATARDAPFPALINIDPLLAQTYAAPQSQAEVADMNARIAGLRARADRLRGPIIPASLRARMARGVDTTALP